MPTPDPPADTGGLIVMVRPDPATAARAIAADLHATLAIGGAETERALEHLEARQLAGDDFEALNRAMRRAEAVRDATRSRAAEELSRSLNTKVAIHPDTMRRAAIELQAAQAALDAAIRRGLVRERRGRRARVGAGMGAAGGGVAAAALVAPPIGAAVAAAGLIATGTSWAIARRRPLDLHTSLVGHIELARSRWEQMAGAGADPADVEAIIHRYDPTDRVVASLVGEHPAVRAADRVALERRMAWVAAWRRKLGDASPLTDPTVSRLLERDRTELWLTDDPLRAHEEPETLVVAAPYADLPDERARELHRRLLGVPRAQRVIVVLAPDPDAPNGARIPGIGWVPAISAG
jgi:hypothetical protein